MAYVFPVPFTSCSFMDGNESAQLQNQAYQFYFANAVINASNALVTVAAMILPC